MKKIILSTVAASLLTVSFGYASSTDDMSLEERVALLEDKEAEAYEKKKNEAILKKSKVSMLEFSGVHYFGLTSAEANTMVSIPGGDQAKYADTSTGFEMRRNYLQVKAFINEKDYFRVTLDATKELGSNEVIKVAIPAADLNGDGDTKDPGEEYKPSVTQTRNGYANAFVKYAYLWLDDITPSSLVDVIPQTGVEIGIAHRPWIDYEEHNSWYYRSFNKVIVEEKGTRTESGVDLVNSADLGFNLKSKSEYFSSEIGAFNGEGYHADKDAANQNNSTGMSFEYRLTGHVFGNGTDVGKYKRDTDEYANISTYGLISKNHKDDSAALDQTSTSALKGEYDRDMFGIHAVYNQPLFLIAAQYFIATDEAIDQNGVKNWGNRDYTGFSVNAEVRPIEDWTIIGRYDDYAWDDTTVGGIDMSSSTEGSKIIAALAYKYNKNVTFIASGKFIDEEYTVGSKDKYTASSDTGESKNVYMLTTEVKW